MIQTEPDKARVLAHLQQHLRDLAADADMGREAAEELRCPADERSDRAEVDE